LQFVWNNFNKYPLILTTLVLMRRVKYGFYLCWILNFHQEFRNCEWLITSGSDLKAANCPSIIQLIGVVLVQAMRMICQKMQVYPMVLDLLQEFIPSKIVRDYYQNYTGENTFIVGYPELCFNIAEGYARGWASGSAEDWYKKG
jgi:hypothetical protein